MICCVAVFVQDDLVASRPRLSAQIFPPLGVADAGMLVNLPEGNPDYPNRGYYQKARAAAMRTTWAVARPGHCDHEFRKCIFGHHMLDVEFL